MKSLGRNIHIAWDAVSVGIALLVCVGFSFITYPLRDTWPGLPPPLKKEEATLYGYGDTQLAYRNIGMMLQNAGDVGGRVTNLKDYDYGHVEDWLWLTYDLDAQANYVPSLAAFYFGAVQDKEKLRHLLEYLTKVGQQTGNERWRWLAHAVYLARFRVEDQDEALRLAEILAHHAEPDMPIWTKQMPAFVMAKVGAKKAARDLMLTIAATEKNIDPADINQTCWYINEHLREKDDGMDTNKIYQALCTRVWDTSHKDNKK